MQGLNMSAILHYALGSIGPTWESMVILSLAIPRFITSSNNLWDIAPLMGYAPGR